MDRSSAASYVYAKAAGILTRAYVGENAIKLFNAESIPRLWEMVFETPVPMIPESMLATKLEKDAANLFISEYIKLLEVYDRPSKFLVQLMDRYEVENVKAITAALSYGETSHPHCVKLGRFAKIHIENWPDIQKMTEGSDFAWVDSVPVGAERQRMDYRLDLQEFRELWRSMNSVRDESRTALKRYFTREMAITNLLWALRLKVYYKYSDQKVIENLYYVGKEPSAEDPLCVYAYDIFERKLDLYADWKDWKFAEYLNPFEEGVVWSVNPMWLEQRFRSLALGLEKRLFHQYPMTDLSLAMFFRLKQQELNCIRAATEALRLGSDKTEAMYVAGISGRFGDINGKNN